MLNKCTCSRYDLEPGEHWITCPTVLSPEVLECIGLRGNHVAVRFKRKEVVRMATKKVSKKNVKTTKKR